MSALDVTGSKRASSLPEVPTIAETVAAGVSGKISKAVVRALSPTDLREQLIKFGAEPMSMSPAEFARFVHSEMEVAAHIIKEAGIKPQ